MEAIEKNIPIGSKKSEVHEWIEKQGLGSVSLPCPFIEHFHGRSTNEIDMFGGVPITELFNVKHDGTINYTRLVVRRPGWFFLDLGYDFNFYYFFDDNERLTDLKRHDVIHAL